MDELSVVPSKETISSEERTALLKKNKDFRNFKNSIVRHMDVNCVDKEEERDPLVANREKTAGLAVGRTAYTIVKEGLAYAKFPKLLLLNHLNSAEIGRINHSRDFMPKFVMNVKTALAEKVSGFLSTPLKKTGDCVPISVVDDLAMYQRETRQFVSAITVIPNDVNLLRAIPLAAKTVTSDGRSGVKIAATIKNVIKEFAVKPEQIVSTTFDGAFIHEKVNEKLSEQLGVPPSQIHNCYDAMHKGKIRRVNNY